ncbi:EI24 domain-containing protein [Crocinitomix algicola]|uniref:EI24 domain-containing protein n=1 Tax=Crocinitomix algicola TaxID=1740263 RepID=UPI0008363560|nr:EI24 domain-containing protein [Crocinitomix algicola]
MNFFQLLGLGYKNYIKGIRFLLDHKLYWFILFPLILFVGVYWLGLYFEAVELSIGRDLVANARELETLRAITWRTVQMIFFDSLNMIFTKFTLYIVVIILSPIIALLSERIEQILTGNKYKFSFKQLVNDIRRGIQIAMRNIFWEYFFIVIILGIASFFNSTIKDILIFSLPIAIGFYFYGFAFIDYINERRRLNIQQSVYFVSKHRGLAISIGSIYSIFFLSFFYVFRSFATLPSDTSTQLFWGTILVITFLLAALAPILAITSATLSMHEIVDLNKNDYAVRTKNTIGEKNDEEEENNVDNIE